MNVRILKIAQREFYEARDYYELEQQGLGNRFTAEIKKSLKRIKEYLQAFPEVKPSIRKCFIHKFPYKIFFSIIQSEILILAFAHQHRKPNYFLKVE